MSEVIIPDDPRDAYQKMSRRDVWKALKHSKIDFRAGCTHEDGVKLLQANEIDPMTAIEWETIYVEDEKKQKIPQQHPVRKQVVYSEADIIKRDAEMETRLKAAADNESKEEIDDLKALIAKQTESIASLTTMVTDMKNGDIKVEEVVVIKKETDPMNMKYMAQKKWLKTHGIELKKGDNVKELITKAMEDVKDPS